MESLLVWEHVDTFFKLERALNVLIGVMNEIDLDNFAIMEPLDVLTYEIVKLVRIENLVCPDSLIGITHVAWSSFCIFSPWSLIYSASIFRISVDLEGVTSISFLASVGTLVFLYNSVINTWKARDIKFCYSCMLIFKAMMVPWFVLSSLIMYTRKAF